MQRAETDLTSSNTNATVAAAAVAITVMYSSLKK